MIVRSHLSGHSIPRHSIRDHAPKVANFPNVRPPSAPRTRYDGPFPYPLTFACKGNEPAIMTVQRTHLMVLSLRTLDMILNGCSDKATNSVQLYSVCLSKYHPMIVSLSRLAVAATEGGLGKPRPPLAYRHQLVQGGPKRHTLLPIQRAQ